jgi:hypothetical protein
MGTPLSLLVHAFLAIGLMCLSVPPASAQDPEIDKLLLTSR